MLSPIAEIAYMRLQGQKPRGMEPAWTGPNKPPCATCVPLFALHAAKRARFWAVLEWCSKYKLKPYIQYDTLVRVAGAVLHCPLHSPRGAGVPAVISGAGEHLSRGYDRSTAAIFTEARDR